jgi:Tfp pilus assembly protein FimT
MQRSGSFGISIAEFTVALFIVTITALYAAPMYYKAVNDYRATQYTNELVATLRYARAQAVTQARAVSVCSSEDGINCTNTPWASGYIVFVDNDAPGTRESNDHLLRRHLVQKPAGTITLRGNRFVHFDPNGGLVSENSDESRGVTMFALKDWFDDISLIPAAHAAPSPAENASSDDSFDKTSAGIFTVCVGRAGRTIRLSLQGRITTLGASCSQ